VAHLDPGTVDENEVGLYMAGLSSTHESLAATGAEGA